MKRVRFGDVVIRANTKEDKNNTEKEYYLDGQYFEGEELEVEKGSPLAGATIGPMFYFGFKSGQVLFMSRSFAIKKAAVARFDGICSEKTFVLETKDPSILLQDYLVFILQNQLFWNYCEENKSGSVNFFINWSTLDKYEFDLPDIEEQKRISDCLWSAYKVKKSYRKMISAIDEMVKSQFIAHFRGRDNKRISDVCEIHGGSTPNRKVSEYWDGGIIPWFTVEDIYSQGKNISATQQHITEKGAQKVYIYPINTVLICCTASVGECAITRVPMGSNQQFNGLTVKDDKELIPDFLLYVASTLKDKLLQNAGKTTINFVSRTSLEGILIPVPSINEQQRFVEIVNQADKSKFELKQAIEKIDKVMLALMQ